MHTEISISSLLQCVCECHLVVVPRDCLQKYLQGISFAVPVTISIILLTAERLFSLVYSHTEWWWGALSFLAHMLIHTRAFTLSHTQTHMHRRAQWYHTAIPAGYSAEQAEMDACRANNQCQLTWDEYFVCGWLFGCSTVSVTPVSLPRASVNIKDTRGNKQGSSGCIFICKHPIMAITGCSYRLGVAIQLCTICLSIMEPAEEFS